MNYEFLSELMKLVVPILACAAVLMAAALIVFVLP